MGGSSFFLSCLCVDDLGVGIVARQAALLGGELQGLLAVEFGLADQFFDAVGEALSGICVRARVGGSFGSDQKRNFSSSADGPGIGTTGMWCRRQSVTRRWPGSETSGMPASLTRAIFAPCSSATTSSGARVSSLCSW